MGMVIPLQVSLLEGEAEKKAVKRDSMLAEIDAIT